MGRMSAGRETFLADIVVTAVEGGIGYWSQVDQYRWYYPDVKGGTAKPGANGGGYAEALVIEVDDYGDPEDRFKLTPFVVARGIRRILRGEVPLRSDIVRELRNANAENDAGYIDSIVADCIVQAGLLGEVRYG